MKIVYKKLRTKFIIFIIILAFHSIPITLLTGQTSLPAQFNKLFFTDSKFNRPIYIEIPNQSSIEKYQDISNNPDIYTSGIPKVYVNIGTTLKEFDRNLITYLVMNKIARIESLHQTTHNSQYGDKTVVFDFIFYNPEYNNKIFKDDTRGETKFYLLAGKRKLNKITYQNQYEDAPLGMKRTFFSIVFNYQIANNIPNIGNENIIYTGKGKAYLDPDDGVWKTEGAFDNLGLKLDDNDQFEYLKLIRTIYPPFDFQKNQEEMLLKLERQKDSINLSEERLKKYNDSIAISIKYPNKVIYPDCSVFYGTINEDQRNGNGIMQYANGDKYEGNWLNNVKNGNGTMEYHDGTKYEGEWLNDLREGQGKFKFKDGSVFDGIWKSNLKEGKGRMTFDNGNIYYGEWNQDICNKKGTMIYFGGQIYEGEMIDFIKNGQGKMDYKNGFTYDGQWKNDVENGIGKETFGLEQIKEGEFLNGSLKTGKYTYKLGETIYIDSGEFETNTLRNGTRTYKLINCPKCAITQTDVVNSKTTGKIRVVK